MLVLQHSLHHHPHLCLSHVAGYNNESAIEPVSTFSSVIIYSHHIIIIYVSPTSMNQYTQNLLLLLLDGKKRSGGVGRFESVTSANASSGFHLQHSH